MASDAQALGDRARGWLAQLLEGRSLDEGQAGALLEALASGDLDPALAGGLLCALRAKGESAEEIRGFARAMRALAITPALDAQDSIDIVGTGGDGSGSLNLSTGVSLLTAACGLRVVKHGNRSVSSRSGSADVLGALNGALPPSPAEAGDCLDATGFTFLFAPHFHPAMKAIGPVRQALKARTIFNVLGPLTNPAAPPYYLLGAFSAPMARLMAQALAGLPLARGFVVHGAPGWDEATPCGPFELFDVRDGEVHHEVRDPESLGLARCAPQALAGGDAQVNATHLRAALAGDRAEAAHIDALVLGCALALEVSGRVASAAEGVELARETIDGGAARTWLERLQSWEPAG
ncbi:MAG: anthranilate phosphoribosyltransferase [Pseudomonadota bacterium]